MKRIAIVVQRYGAEVNGGAELHARLLANALKAHYQVDVLTSRALDYQTWNAHYPAGEQWLEGCRILRFDHPPRNRGRHKRMPLGAKLRWKLRRWFYSEGAPLVKQPNGNPHRDGLLLLRAQGPTMDGLMDYLKQRGGDYAALIFMTALYHPSAVGVLARPERSILVPTLHDEKTMYLPHFHRVFRAPQCIMYNTAAEQKVAERLYGQGLSPGQVCGVGIELPPDSRPGGSAEWSLLTTAHGIDAPYLLYVGRIDRAKGCATLIEHFLRWRTERGAELKLVMVGQAFMDLPSHPAVVYTGFVSTEARDALIEHAEAMVIPSRYESLSLVLLEALARGCAVIVNRESEVLQQHVDDSGVGHGFADYREFASAVDRTLGRSAPERERQALQGRDYVAQRYTWPRVIEKFQRVIESLPAQTSNREPAEHG